MEVFDEKGASGQDYSEGQDEEGADHVSQRQASHSLPLLGLGIGALVRLGPVLGQPVLH